MQSTEVSHTCDAFNNLNVKIGESDNPFPDCGGYYDAESQTCSVVFAKPGNNRKCGIDIKNKDFSIF